MEPGSVVAYAANELRDEITLQRALAEVALANPSADISALRKMGEKVIAASERQGRLLDALLTLARCEYERLRRLPAIGYRDVVRAERRKQPVGVIGGDDGLDRRA